MNNGDKYTWYGIIQQHLKLWILYATIYYVRNAIMGHDLFGYVDGSNPFPPHHLPYAVKDLEGVIPINLAFQEWVKQDQLILSEIYESVSEGGHAQIVRCPTSRDAWLRLEHSFVSASKVRVITSMVDRLATVLKPISNVDLVLFVLGGLGLEYGSFVTIVTDWS
ncbi:hypothetical protein BVC80_1803g27 [Macleaya cordata]|uniref:Uncharacterized protein n=1 Tax=Macleaya cordata TaxID=56857 RepID=A0A200QR17_MACCD|nr:hypothetical protein BVC80_1803g27 [Macleaya cordata]